MPGLVATPQGRVFVATEYKIYEVADGQAAVYLTDVEAYSAIGGHNEFGFGDLAVDASGTVYATYSGSIIRLGAPHQVNLWRMAPGTPSAPAMRLGPVGADDVVALGTEGMWRVTEDEPASPLLTFEEEEERCPYADFALAASGTFLIQPDCAHMKLQRGRFDGSTVSTLETVFEGTFPPSGSMSPAEFLCATTDPDGGFYVVVLVGGSYQLYHLADEASGGEEIIKIESTPSLDALKESSSAEGDNQVFRRCKLGAASGGTVYIQTSRWLWQMTPEP